VHVALAIVLVGFDLLELEGRGKVVDDRCHGLLTILKKFLEVGSPAPSLTIPAQHVGLS